MKERRFFIRQPFLLGYSAVIVMQENTKMLNTITKQSEDNNKISIKGMQSVYFALSERFCATTQR
jgi:hypothetical protein